MGRYFALTLNLGPQLQTKTKAKSAVQNKAQKINLGPWLFVILIVLGMFYLFTVNAISTKGYDIKHLEKQVTDLQNSNKQLELEAASLKSIQRLQASVKALNLVPSKTVNYIGASGYAFQN